MSETWQPAGRTVRHYFDRPDYIDALAEIGRTPMRRMSAEPEILSAPTTGCRKRYLMQGDPYHCQCQKTTRLLRERLGWDGQQIITTFQSKFRPRGMAAALHRRKRLRDWPRRARRNRGDRAGRSRPTASRRWKRSTRRSGRVSRTRGRRTDFTYIPCLNDAARAYRRAGADRFGKPGRLDRKGR